MIRLLQAVAGAALVSAAMAGAPAQAATTITLTGNSGGSGSFGNTRTFSGTSGGETITVTASGWSMQDGNVTSAYLGAFSNGLGVTNRSEGNGSNNRHTIDNSGGIDFVLFQFTRPVDLLSASLRQYGDTDATFFALDSMPSGALTPLTSFLSIVQGGSNSFGDKANRTAFEGTTRISNIWGVSALNPANGAADAFKLRSISIEAVGAVPEPSTWAMMLLGFFGIGAGMRRKHRAEKVTLTYA